MPNRIQSVAAIVFLLPLAAATAARADIFQWEYINPADPGQGKQQSTTLAPDGAGVNAVPLADLRFRNLTMAYLIGADLTSAIGGFANLTNADLSQSNLTNVHLHQAGLAGANLTGAIVQGADLSATYGFSAAQLYSTASYQARDLRGLSLYWNDLSGWNFAGQNLEGAYFGAIFRENAFPLEGAVLAGANFAEADLRGADFNAAVLDDANLTAARIEGAAFGRFNDIWFPSGPSIRGGISVSQLYSTASYQAKNLSRVDFWENNLAGANFAGQNLTNARFGEATLTGADFAGADVRGASFYQYSDSGTGITLAQLYSTASYQAHDLSGITLSGVNLAGANFAGQNLTNASLYRATLNDADFSGADVRGASFDDYFGGTGITLAQLYSTASYQARDLRGIGLEGNDLSGGNFVGQNLANASLYRATLTGADFTGADVRGAYSLYTDAITTNLIGADGHIAGLELSEGQQLVIRDYDGNPSVYPFVATPIPITVDQHLTMTPGGTLRMLFEADAWDSTISFAPAIPVTLGGTLELTFADDVNLASQVGRTFHIFDWSGVSPTGVFTVSSPYTWDRSNLYTTGEITLAAIPEPSAFALFVAALAFGSFGARFCPMNTTNHR